MKAAPGDGFAKRDGPLELFYPRNGWPSWAGSAGAAWAWPANYTQIAAATAESFAPHELNLLVGVTALVADGLGIWVEYELATGAAGSEVVIHRHTEAVSNYVVAPGVGTQNLCAFGRTLDVGPKEIPSGTRLSHRIRISEAATYANVAVWAYLGGYAGGGVPLTYTPYGLRPHLAGVHKAKSDISVQGDAYALMTPAAMPNYGNWAQVIDPAPADLIIRALADRQTNLLTTGYGLYVEIGTGAAGFEVPRRRMGIPFGSSLRQAGLWRMRYPLFVKKGERVAVRGSGIVREQRIKLLWEAL